MAGLGSPNFALGWQGIALALALMGNVLWLHKPLRSPRPEEKPHWDTELRQTSRASARLWQDPFEAVASTGKWNALSLPGPHGGDSALAKLREAVCKRLAGNGGTDRATVTMLPVMVTGSPYSDGGEWRIRSRYAVLAGLSQSRGLSGERYVPVDCEHICFARIPLGKGNPSLAVPYEWLERSSPDTPDDRESVLVLWLRAESFEENPLAKLNGLVDALRSRGDTNGVPYTAVQLPAMIIGPWGSTTLREMLRECTNSLAVATTSMTVYSASATAADWRLDPHFRSSAEPREEATSKLGSNGVAFVNLTCTDDQMSRVLVEELALRDIHVAEGDRIALLSEWDTFYGRALPQSFIFAATKGLSSNQVDVAIKNIRVFSYLRGLDGRVVSRDGEASRGETPDKGRGRSVWPGDVNPDELERPEGSSQWDYARRLASRMKAIERQEGRKGSVWNADRWKFRAVGVLGSDVYDKLLLVQALRDRFPEAVFFTTDLDARLTHPGELRWTRAMVVASSFGLQLRDELQGDIPPFRDTYQTAYFLATQVAMGSLDRKQFADLEPRVFEIGRKRACDLTPARKLSEEEKAERKKFRKSVHPEPLWRRAWPLPQSLFRRFVARPVCALLALVCVAFALWSANRYVAELSDGYRRMPGGRECVRLVEVFVALVCSASVLLALVALTAHLWSGDEPFTIVGGISIWPTEFIRLVAISLAAWFLASESRAALAEKRQLEHDYQDRTSAGTYCASWQLPAWWRVRTKQGFQVFRRAWGRTWIRASVTRWRMAMMVRCERSGGYLQGEQILGGYIRLGRWPYRLFRILPAMAGFMAVVLLMMIAGGFPEVPCRGTISRVSDHVMIAASVGSMLLCLFYLVDATRLCSALIYLVAKPTRWERALDHHRARLGLDRRCDEAVANWLDVRVIADCTHRAGSLIQTPFLILLLMIVSRSSFFDRWAWPWPLLVAVGASFTIAIISVLRLRAAAEKARRASLRNLNRELCKVLGGVEVPGGPRGKAADQVRALIAEVQHMRRGAFAPLTERPVFRAMLMPFGGMGILALLEFLATL